MKYFLFPYFLFFTLFNLAAQENLSSQEDEMGATTFKSQGTDYRFTLEEAISFALDSNYTAINARRDIAAALKKKWETTARGLPQISANVNYLNRLKQPVQLIPAEFFGGEPGTFLPVSFGTKQQLGATATANQLIFDGTYLVGLQAAKTFLEYSENAAEKTALEVRKSVINAYGNVLLAKASVEIANDNKTILEENLSETQRIYQNGLIELESVEQLQITLAQVENQLRNARRMVDITKGLLNLALGIPLSETVILEDDLKSLTQENISITLLNQELEIEKNVNYQIARNLTEQRQLEVKLEKNKALPTLSTFVNYGTVAYNQDFTFFQGDQNWFQSSIWGVSLNIPIFSSFARNSRTQQAEIALKQAKTQFTQAKQQIRLQLNTAQSDYQFAIENYQTAQSNLELAERILNKNQIKFGEGLATSFELRQAQTQLYTAQQNLLQAMLDIITAKAELETILNTPDINIEIK